MPVDSIITTIITSDMVAISTGSKIGMPKRKGVTTANQPASATRSKCIMPRPAAKTQPMTMPVRTAMLLISPRP
ncbi:hypothetical protein D3C87_2011880 [compost metagenome]